MTTPILLDHRAVISVSGADAETFLQGILTNGTMHLQQGERRYGALLTPQGTIIADLILARTGEGFLLAGDAAQASALVKRLTLFRLRAKVEIAERADLGVIAFDGEPDPRSADAPTRSFGPRGNSGDLAPYHAARIAAGVAEQG